VLGTTLIYLLGRWLSIVPAPFSFSSLLGFGLGVHCSDLAFAKLSHIVEKEVFHF
jgi:hypothetical protein